MKFTQYFTLILFLSVLNLTFSQDKNVQSGQLNSKQFEFVNKAFKWGTKEFLIINYTHSKENCSYDVGANIGKNTSINWWEKFYKTLDTTNIANRFVYADKLAAEKIINEHTHFLDNLNFVFNTFLSKYRNCYGVVVINKNGNYFVKGSEYTFEDILSFIDSLKH